MTCSQGSSWLSGQCLGTHPSSRPPVISSEARLGSRWYRSPCSQQLGCYLALSRYLGNICYEKAVKDSQARLPEPRNGPGVAVTGLSPYPGLGTLPLAAPRSRCVASRLEAGRDLCPAGSGESSRHLGVCTESPPSLTYKQPEVGQELCGF